MRLCVLTMVATLSLAAGAHAQQWGVYASAEDRFEAEFPGRVAKEPLKLNVGSIVVRSHNYSVTADDRILMVSAILYREGTPGLDRGAEAGFGRYRCSSRTSDKALPHAGGAAREITGSGCLGLGAEVVARWFQTGSWLYSVQAIIAPTSANRAVAKRFIDSFKVTQP